MTFYASLTSALASCAVNVSSCDDTDSKAIFIFFALLILGVVVWRLLNGPEKR